MGRQATRKWRKRALHTLQYPRTAPHWFRGRKIMAAMMAALVWQLGQHMQPKVTGGVGAIMGVFRSKKGRARATLFPRLRRSWKLPVGKAALCMQMDSGYGEPCLTAIYEKKQIKCFVHRGGDRG